MHFSFWIRIGEQFTFQMFLVLESRIERDDDKNSIKYAFPRET